MTTDDLRARLTQTIRDFPSAGCGDLHFDWDERLADAILRELGPALRAADEARAVLREWEQRAADRDAEAEKYARRAWAAEEVLRDIEWSRFDAGANCPCCGRAKRNGHKPDCSLASALRALDATATPAGDLRPGWKLVQVEPTPEMIEAAWNDAPGGSAAATWAAMLSAAPEPPAAPLSTPADGSERAGDFFAETAKNPPEVAPAASGTPAQGDGVTINRNTGRPCGHEYVRVGTLTDPNGWVCDLCGARIGGPSHA